MSGMFRSVAAVASVLLAAPAFAAPAAADDCAALNYLLAQARTDFPALRGVEFNRAKCSLVRQEFKCEWGFPGNMFATAEEQAERLVACTTAQPGAHALGKKRGELAFELNPETSAFIRGPEMRSGDWKLRLRVVSTAEWD